MWTSKQNHIENIKTMKDVNIKQVKGVEGQLYSFDLTIDNSYNTLYNNIVFKRERSK